MTAVERQVPPMSFLGEKMTDAPASHFTAVNGRDSGTNASAGPHTNGHYRRDSIDKPQPQNRSLSPRPERMTAAANSNWPPPLNGVSARPQEQQYSHSANTAESEKSHKRKRSGSEETDGVGSKTYNSQEVSPSTVQDSRTSPENNEAKNESSNMPPPHAPSRNPYPERDSSYQYSDESRDHARYYAQQAQERIVPVSRHINPDEHLREALARETQAEEAQNGGYRSSPPEDDNNGSYQGDYGDNRESQIQQDERKKRKRNFSNRTKTGCMTCRRRKKKCDETRPECNNCIRGGFVCNGYPSRGPWQKAEPKQAPVPLQSKDGYDGGQGHYNQGPSYQQQYPPQNHQPRREPLPNHPRQQPPRVDTQHPRIYGMDDDRQPTMPPRAGSPERRMSGVSYSQSSPFPTPVSAHPNPNAYAGFSQGVKRMGSIQEPPRNDRDLPAPSGPSQNYHISILNPPHSDSPTLPPPTTSAAQDAARAALSHPASASHQAPVSTYQAPLVLPPPPPPPVRRLDTQKQQMLHGQFYFPFDKELVAERERCLKACYVFNNALNPVAGLSEGERAARFRAVIQPTGRVDIANEERTPVSLSGAVGRNVVVESPFWCDYGYNIHIGQHVAIGRNCTIVDCAEVRIGDKTILGPNVSIYTNILPIPPRQRKGCEGPQRGAKVLIENDCWIGGGVTITHNPGSSRPITIGEGSSILPGSVVTTDVPKFTVFSGNPAVNQGSIHDN